ncbi:MAG: hypothetical protein HYW07_17630 [Candidatus Latescibacteria bacterium]|nr:hypothetical protein [Candidatus Latescibacterota bacterium]
MDQVARQLAGQVHGRLVPADPVVLGQALDGPADQARPDPHRQGGVPDARLVRVELPLGEVGVVAPVDGHPPQPVDDAADLRVPGTGRVALPVQGHGAEAPAGEERD